MRVLVCLDKFRGSLTARQACAALATGIRAAAPRIEVIELPVADGGEGTVDALVHAGWTRHTCPVTGPDGAPVQAAYATRNDRAVIELAEAAGHHLLAAPAPLTATTFGVGELVTAARSDGAREIVLTLGGSATTDGGAGMLQALGARLLDASGRAIGPGGGALCELDTVDLDGLPDDVTCTVATDVDNPLLGADGAAAVFGPQKGAGPADIDMLERGLTRWADLLAAVVGADRRDDAGAGAAGGAGFGAITALGARRVSGVAFLLDEVDVTAELAGADLVVVGEGSLDAQTLAGKAPIGVARLAAEHGVPAVAVAGAVTVTQARLGNAGIGRSYAIVDVAADTADAIANAADHLADLGGRIVRDLDAR